MKAIWKYAFLSCMTLGAVSFVGCDDDDAANDEWSAAYVYIESERFDNTLSYSKTYKKEVGITDPAAIEVPLRIKISRIQKQDVTVDLTSNAAELIGESMADLTLPEQVIIKAGTRETVITLSLATDFLTKKAAPEIFDFKIELAKVAGGSNVLISPKRNLLNLNLTKGYNLGAIMVTGTPSGSVLSGATWKISHSSGWRGNLSLPLTNTGSDMAKDGGFPAYFVLDMGDAQTLGGIAYNCWGASYSPKELQVLISDDNTLWTELETVSGIRGNMKFIFTEALTARYLKILVKSANSSTISFTKFYVYGPAAE